MEPAIVTFGDGSETDFQTLEKRVDGLYVELLLRQSLSKGERFDDKLVHRLNPDLKQMSDVVLSAELLRLHPKLYGTGRVHEPWRFLSPSFTESKSTGIQEIQRARGEQLVRAAHVVILALAGDLERTSTGKFTLKTRIAGDRHRLCPKTRFFAQPTIGVIGSGYLVGPSTILTANHCLTDPEIPLEEIRFVFGFDRGDIPIELDSRSVFQAKKEVWARDEGENDWALVELTEEVGREPLSVREDRISHDEEVYVIGHPFGLPKKLAEGARVRDNEEEASFVANLDVFGGNSGSPVFNARDHRLEGVLREGDGFFVDCSGDCQRPIACHGSCTGEIVTRITEVFKDFRPEDLP